MRGLPSVAHCGDAVGLESEAAPPDDEAIAEGVETQRAALARARALSGVGRYADALDLAEDIEKVAVDLDFAPFVAEARAFRGTLAMRSGRYDEAYERLTDALRLALAHRRESLAVDIVTDLVIITSDRLGRPEEGNAWATMAVGLARARDPGGALEASALSAQGTALRGQGRYREAEAAIADAIALSRKVHGDDSLQVASMLSNRGAVLKQLGRYDEALELAQEAQRLVAVIHGPEHPTVASTMNTIAGVLLEKGDLEAAEAKLREAADLRRKVLGDDHPLVAATLDNHAGVLARMGRLEEAFERATLAFSLAEKTLGPDNPEMALFHANLGTILATQGKADDAIGHLEKAIEIQQGAYGAEHPSLTSPLDTIGELLFAEGRVDEAIVHLERGCKIAQSPDVAAPVVARTCMSFADALWSRPDDRARATEVVRSVRARLTQGGSDSYETYVDAADKWLEAHVIADAQ